MRPIKLSLGFSLSALALAFFISASTRDAEAVKPTAGAGVRAQLWQAIAGRNAIVVPDWKVPPAGEHQVLQLNKDVLAETLARAPMERTADLTQSQAVLALPMPDGSFQRFQIEESPVLDADLAAQYPQIKSYRGRGLDDATATVRFDWTPLGLHALVLFSAKPAVNIQPPNPQDVTTYVSYYDQRTPFECGVTEKSRLADTAARADAPQVANGTMLRTERLAVAATWEFCNTIGNNTVADTIAAINAYLNAANAVYERELSVHMNLVNAPQVIYAANNNVCGAGNSEPCTAANDPYTNTTQSTMLGEVMADLGAKVGSANFDVGHVLGTGSAGVAGLGVVCDDDGGAAPNKARGASRIFGPPGNSSATNLWAHELGHQHGGSHSFNGTNGNCGPARSQNTAWEAGSGSTLMSYGGICASDNLADGNDFRLGNGTYNEILTYLGTTSCAVLTPTGNNVPTVNAGAPYTIPKQTPFILTGAGSDADAGDVPNLTFVWEQLDSGGSLYANPPYGDQPGDPPSTTRPLFRTFPPTSDRSRTFPSLTYILNNANVPPATVGGFQTAENLPSVSRTMNFRCTVRDQRGGVNDSPVAISVDGNSGPFAVTFPNEGQTIGGMQNVTWSVNGTNLAPVNVANVRISLSTDGGNTFPTVLLASTPNDGSSSVTLPNGILKSTARIKIEAIGNIFFDISDANFTITPGDGCPAASNFTPQVGPPGTVVTITGVNFTGVTGVTFNGVPAASFNVVNDTQITATVPNGAGGGPIVVSKAGCINLSVGRFSFCPNPPGVISIDDGGIETAYSGGANAFFVNRLTPASYPATVKQLSIYFHPGQSLPAGTPINVVAAANPTGNTNINGLTFQSVPATIGTLNAFNTYNLPEGVTINSGDFVVGFQIVGNPAGFPAASDEGSPQGRSYIGNGTSFSTIGDVNFMIRASQVFADCTPGVITPQILSINRNPNGHVILQCLGTPNQVNNLQAAPNPNGASFGPINPSPPAADANGAFTFDDAQALGFSQRYYKLLIP